MNHLLRSVRFNLQGPIAEGGEKKEQRRSEEIFVAMLIFPYYAWPMDYQESDIFFLPLIRVCLKSNVLLILIYERSLCRENVWIIEEETTAAEFGSLSQDK
uniref:Uncharacterized protein n=1 Tax=Romanomermis culicivorax TaxID=13658 RepID=A0A915IDC1_ROMCU